jgi:DNA-binding NtrC family response regulator
MRASLRAHGLSARITRIDFPAALHAALVRTVFDLVIYDPATSAISHDVLATSMREHEQTAPVIVMDGDDIGELAAAKLQQRRN